MPSVRGRNEGTLFLRKRDRRWVAMVTMPDGRRRSSSDLSKDVAVGLLRDLIDQRDRSVVQDPRRLRVGTYLRQWIASVQDDLAPATWRKHEGIIRVHIIPALGGLLLSDLSVSDVRRFLSGRRRDAQTVRHMRATLRRALADAVRDGLVARNVAALAPAPKMQKAERTYLTTGQARRIIEEARDERYWPLWVLILTTGLRVSEALGLAWSDIDLPNRSLKVQRQLVRVNGEWGRGKLKTRQSRRSIELVPQAVEALTEQRKRQDAERGDYPQPIDGLVFTTPTGQPVHSTNVLPPWYATLVRLRLPRVTTHDLRHSAASMMLAAGVPLPVIAATLGHSSIRVTADLYSHVGVDLRREAADRLAEALR